MSLYTYCDFNIYNIEHMCTKQTDLQTHTERFFNPGNSHFTSLFGCHLTGDTWDVTIKSSPASLTLAAISGSPLPATSPVLTG